MSLGPADANQEIASKDESDLEYNDSDDSSGLKQVKKKLKVATAKPDK